MAGTTMTIFICAVVLSLYGPRLWEAATDAVGVGPHAIGDAVNEIWSHGPPEVLWIAAKTACDTFTRLVENSPPFVRENVWAAHEAIEPIIRILSALPDLSKGAVALIKTSRTIIHLACKGKEHYADGFLATIIYISLSEAYRWVKLLIRFWLLVVVVLCSVRVLA